MSTYFDPTAGRVVCSPPGVGVGYWVGAPGVFYDAGESRFYLCYRLRRPRGEEPDRGFEARIAVSEDGFSYRDVRSFRKEEFASPSIEKCALVREGVGRWHYFVSCVDGRTGKWRIDRLTGEDVDGLDPANRQPIFLPEDLGLEGVKDPWVGRADDGYVMLFSAAKPTAATTPDSHRTADIYSTGECLSVTCLVVSRDLLEWRYEGVVFEPMPGRWDAYCARLNGAVRVAGAWWAPYDGAASVAENYEERCGLASSPDLRNWRRLSSQGPAAVSPHGSGCLRYAVPLLVGRTLFVYYELARPDGAHELRVLSRSLPPFGV